MRRPTSTTFVLALLLLVVLPPGDADAQRNVLETMKEIPAGHIRYRTLSYLEYDSQASPNIMLAPGFGLSGETFRRRVGGAPGWGKLLKERGYNAWMFDNVGVGNAQGPPDDNFDAILEHGMYGFYQIGYAGSCGLVILHEQAAGMGLRARSFDAQYADAMVLIDPIGPQGAQPMLEYDPARLLAERRDPDHVWRTWGFGPARGTVREGLDLSAARAESLYVGYDRTQPAYWAGLLTRYESDYEVREAMNLAGVPVLVVRTPAAGEEQIEREGHVIDWMTERGMLVDRLDLSSHPQLKHVSGLPWTGDLAPEVLEEIMNWYESLEGVPVPLGR